MSPVCNEAVVILDYVDIAICFDHTDTAICLDQVDGLFDGEFLSIFVELVELYSSYWVLSVHFLCPDYWNGIIVGDFIGWFLIGSEKDFDNFDGQTIGCFDSDW